MIKSIIIFLFAGIWAVGFPLLDIVQGQPEQNKHIRVITFNIRYDTPDDGKNAWPGRQKLVTEILHQQNPDLFGIQEALQHQVTQIAEDLPDYSWVGAGRDDGQSAGEFAAVFYRKSRFELGEKNHFWLSETPHKPGSHGWDAACVRIVTWAVFTDQQTGRQLFLFNTHFDHIGQIARKESVRLLKQMVGNIAQSNAVVITGDFNFTPASGLYQQLTDPDTTAGVALLDTRTVALNESEGPEWSFHGFGKASERPLLDYIFVNKHFGVDRHIILQSIAEDPYPSDHLPVIADLFWNKAE